MQSASIRTKLTLVIGTVVVAFVAFNFYFMRSRVEEQLTNGGKEGLRQTADMAAHAIAAARAPGGGRNRGWREERLWKGIEDMPRFAFCATYDAAGRRLSERGACPPWTDEMARMSDDGLTSDPRSREGFLAAATAIPDWGGSAESLLVLGVDAGNTESMFNKNVQFALLTGMAAVLIGVAGSMYAGSRYTRPLVELNSAVQRVASGQFGEVAVHVRTGDELEELAESFKQMTSRLKASRDEIESHNRLMEFRVQDKTRQLMETIWELEDMRANLEEVLQERTKDFQRLKEFDRMKDEFFANVSHELRTPLNAVIGFSGLLLQDKDSPLPRDVQEDLNIIYQNGRNLQEMVENILDISKMQAGRFDLELKEMDPLQVLEDVRVVARGLILDRPIELVYEAPDWNAAIEGDPVRFKQVMVNLVGNSIKFTEKGRVEIRPRIEGGGFIVDVRDTGIGMTAEEMRRLFQPFQQVDGAIARRYGGTGLGLVISKSLVELMRGRISVESAKGLGTTFTVELPLAPAAGGA
jgi:signal transduction histidine kinase